MLTRDQPDLFLRHLQHIAALRCAEREQGNRPAFDGRAQFGQRGLRHLLNCAQKFGVALLAVRLEVRVVNAVELRRVVDGEHPAVIRCRHAKPVHAIVAGHGLVVAPAFRERARRRIFESHHAALAGRAREPEVEPLRELRVAVRPNAQADISRARAGQHLDRACVEVARNR
ncbi:hypothetical protein ABIE53_001623 [Burkholderia sp. OAS925]